MKTIVITGGNSGIGLAVAQMLAAQKFRIVLACRDSAKMQVAARALGSDTAQVVLDLSDLASVRRAAEEIRAKYGAIDVLINNAGVMAIPERKTRDGFEMQFGTNHLGHFAFTGLLLPALSAAPAARVVTVSSMLHERGHIDFDAIPVPKKYSPYTAYNMSKLANALFAFELDRRAKAAGLPIISLACHPGYAATSLQSVGPQMSGSRLMGWIMSVGNRVLAQSAEMGAMPTLYAATSPLVHGGEYIGPDGLFGMRGRAHVAKASASAHDLAVAKRLWERSEELTGARYPFSRAAA